MKKFLFTAGVILFAAYSAFAQKSPPKKFPFQVYLAPAAPESLEASNMEKEKFWKNVPPSLAFKLFKTGEKPSEATRFKALYNKNGLFVRVDCNESEFPALDFSDHGNAHDSGTAFAAPMIELFLDPAFTRKHAAHLVANINSTRFDRLDTNASWNYPFTTKTLSWPDEKGYSIIYFVPWLETTNENPGSGYLFTMNMTSHAVMGFDIARERLCGDRELSQWAVTPQQFLEPSFYGALVLSEAPNAERRMIALFKDKIIENGIEFQGAAGQNVTSILEKIAKSKIGAASGLLAGMKSSPQKTEFEKALASLSRKSDKKLSDEELKKLVTEISTLFMKIEEFSFKKLESEVFDEF